MATVLEELVTILGFEIEDEDLKDLRKNIDSAESAMKKILVTATAAATGMSLFVNSIAEGTDETFKFSKTLGAAFDEVQRLTHATHIWGGSTQDVLATLTSLSNLTASAARGGGGSEVFGFLGISPTDAQTGRARSTVELLGEIADRIRQIDNEAEQVELASRFGISQNMVLLLRQGSEGIAQLGAELDAFGVVLTPEQGRIAEAYVDSMVRGKLAIRGMANEIGLRLAPRMSETINQFIEWRKANKDIIDTKLVEWADRLWKAMRPLTIAVGIIAAILAVWFVAANAVAIGIGAIAVALGLLIDDITRFVRGDGKTFTEQILELAKVNWENVKAGVSSAFSGLNPGTVNFGVGATPIFQPGGAIAGSINNNFHIQSSDPNAVAREVDDKLREWGRDTFSNVRSAEQ